MKRSSMLVVAGFVVTGCVSGSSGCEIDPCHGGSPPSFRIDGQPVEGRVRSPSPGRISVEVTRLIGEDDAIGTIAFSGNLDHTMDPETRIWGSVTNDVIEVRSAGGGGAGLIEATDGCGITSRLEIEAAPVASVRARADVHEWIAVLPEELTSGGVMLLPGMPFLIEYALLDADGGALTGRWDDGPEVEVAGGLRIARIEPRTIHILVVEGPEGPATVTLGNAAPLEFDVASGDEAVRLDVRRNDSTVDDWVQGWSRGTPVGEELVLAVGESATLGMHPFDAEGRLLIGTDIGRKSLLVEEAAGTLVEQRSGISIRDGRWILEGDTIVTGLEPGETTVVAQKAGATASFRLRVVEVEAPGAPSGAL